MNVTELRALIDAAIAVDPEMEVCVRFIEEDCTHVGGTESASPEYGCTERQVFVIDGDAEVQPPEGYEDSDPARNAGPAAPAVPGRLAGRPELRRWLSNVIYAFVHDEPLEPTEAELTGELDALEALLAPQPEPSASLGESGRDLGTLPSQHLPAERRGNAVGEGDDCQCPLRMKCPNCPYNCRVCYVERGRSGAVPPLLGNGDRAVVGRKYVVGKSRRNRAICWAPTVDGDVLREILTEVDSLGLERPITIYGDVCTVGETKTFRFEQVVRASALREGQGGRSPEGMEPNSESVPASPSASPVSAPTDAFSRWWEAMGKYVDPDTADVPWADKRRGLAEVAFAAGKDGT